MPAVPDPAPRAWRARHLLPAVLAASLGTALPVPAPAADGAAGRASPMTYDDFVRSVAARALRDMDADRDGLVSREEAAAPPAAAPASAARASAAPGAPAPAPVIPADAATIAADDFAKVDDNGDGRISRDELERTLRGHPAVLRAFRNLDRNGDGRLSPGEHDGVDGDGRVRVVPQVVIPLQPRR